MVWKFQVSDIAILVMRAGMTQLVSPYYLRENHLGYMNIRMIFKTDGNMIAGKVATHGLDGGPPLSQQQIIKPNAMIEKSAKVPKFPLKVFFCEVKIEDCGRNAHRIKPCLASSGVCATFSRGGYNSLRPLLDKRQANIKS
uniref:Uncharacterized protein n=1 Tax=Tanacetum cinerariifolium TaxID=118510 RepID=A0A699HNI0_TANCI|nr:hypothetical protein [Tanacetum cinerariifolium]